MKLCQDCKYVGGDLREYPECRHPNNTEKNYATGETRFKWKYASAVRVEGWLTARLFDSCGKEGRWFEPK